VKSRIVAGAALAWMGMESAHRHHDIHNGLMTILGRIQLIRAKAEQLGDNQTIPDWMEDHLRLIESEIKWINKPGAAPFSSDEGVGDVSITELVCERLKLLWKRPEYCGVFLAERPDPAELFFVRANPEWVGRALDILLDNALQAVARVEPERREISARCRAVGGSVEIAVIDRGRGIPDGVREQLFKVIVDHPAKADGQGRGLLIAQGIIDGYGGTIFVAATGPSGAEMVIRLPMSRRGADELKINI
jgi:signal transduction histidine kinase